MRLSTYLEAREESEAAFARRAGVPQRTLNRIAREEVIARGDTIQKIVRATRAEPTPDGGTVTWDDLVPEEAGDAA